MKKILSVIIIITVILSSVMISAFAYEDTSADIYMNREYGYQYESFTTDDGRIVSSYTKSNNSSTSTYGLCGRSASSTEYTKSVLSDLGVEEDTIELMSDERLNEYAGAESITVVVSYTKTDENGNVTVVDESTAREAASTYAMVLPDILEGNPAYVNTYEDTYMKLSLIVTERGDGYFHHSVDAQWLTMPTVRAYDDLLGISVMESAIQNNTRSGWRRYNLAEESNSSTYTTHTEEFDDDSFVNVSTGNWVGSAVKFQIHQDESDKTYTDYQIHYEFETRVIHYTLATAFNVKVTYEHPTFTLKANPSVNISSLGVVSFDLGLEIFSSTEIRTVELPTLIDYTPEQ